MRIFAHKPKATQQTTTANSPKPHRAFFGQSRDVHSILHLQRTIGNQAVLRFLQTATEKIDASSTNSTPTGFTLDFSHIPVQPTPAPPRFGHDFSRIAVRHSSEEHPKQQLMERIEVGRDERVAVPSVVYEVLRSPGQMLDTSTRATFERQFAHDFSQVRVHTDNRAAESARSVDAVAYTVGRHVVFGAGQYQPGTIDGKALLAHELVHVVQQSHTSDSAPLRIAEIDSEGETEAARWVARPHDKQLVNVHTEYGLYRKPRQGAAAQAQLAASHAEAVARDYANALSYVTDFYSTSARIQDDLGEAAHRSINKFSEISGIPDSHLSANIIYQLIRIALGVLPGAGSVISLFDKLSSSDSLAINAARLATIAGVVAQRTAAGVFTATGAPAVSETRRAAVAALDNLSQFDTEGAQQIERERAEMRGLVERIGRDPRYRNSVLAEVQAALGPLPPYNANVIQQFEREYEFHLYREYYASRAYIHVYESAMWGEHSRSIVDMPESVQLRISELRGVGALQEVTSWGVPVRVTRTSGRPF